MLDMGFEPQIKEILAKVPNGRQTAMFTATWSKECRKIADAYIHNPVHIQIGADEMSANAVMTSVWKRAAANVPRTSRSAPLTSTTYNMRHDTAYNVQPIMRQSGKYNPELATHQHRKMTLHTRTLCLWRVCPFSDVFLE